MATFGLVVTFPESFKDDQTLTVKSILGDEFEQYYDGEGIDLETNERDFFFYDIPRVLIELVPKRLDDVCEYRVTPMTKIDG